MIASFTRRMMGKGQRGSPGYQSFSGSKGLPVSPPHLGQLVRQCQKLFLRHREQIHLPHGADGIDIGDVVLLQGPGVCGERLQHPAEVETGLSGKRGRLLFQFLNGNIDLTGCAAGGGETGLLCQHTDPLCNENQLNPNRKRSSPFLLA